MTGHRTTVTASRSQDRRRAAFYAVCSCGGLRSPSRSTRVRAEQDAREHERNRQDQAKITEALKCFDMAWLQEEGHHGRVHRDQ